MRTPVDLRLVDETRASGFRFRCDDCAHFDTLREACVHEYPVAQHRPRPLEPGDVIVFCKEFELGTDAP